MSTMRWRGIVTIAVVVIVGLMVAVYLVLASYNYNSFKPQMAKAFKEATDRELTLSGNVSLKVGYAPTLVVENVGLQNAAWGSQPEMATIRRFEVQVALVPLIFGKIDVKRLILIDPDILIETNQSGKSNLDFIANMESATEKKGPPVAGRVKITVNVLSIKKGRITYRDGKSGRTYVGMLDSLDAAATDAETPIKMKLKGSYNGEPFESAGALVPLASLTDSSRPWPLDLTVNAAGANFTLGGTIRDVPNLRGLDIRFRAMIKDLVKTSRLVGKPLPFNGSLDISGSVTDPGPQIYRISTLKLALNDSDLAGSVQLDKSGSRPMWSADLASRTLDLRPLLQSPGAQKDKTVGSEREKVFSDQPLPLETLQQADASIKFQATKILLPRLALQNLTAGVALRNGNLTVEPLTAVVGGGALNSRFNLHSQGRTAGVEAAMKIDHLDTAAMLKELAITDVLEGPIDAEINATSRGNSIAGLMAGLNGKIVLLMGNGRIDNKYVRLLGSDLGSSVFRLINPLHKEEQYTEVECIVGGFNIRNGLAETTALVVNTGDMSVIGDGKIDLRTEKLDLELKPIPKGGIGTSFTGKLNLSLGELARPFKLAGTLAHPSLAIDLTQTGMAVGKALGGIFLFGPAGIAGALTGKNSEQKDLCPIAREAAKEGVKLTVGEKKEGVFGKAGEGIKEGAGEVREKLKELFGR